MRRIPERPERANGQRLDSFIQKNPDPRAPNFRSGVRKITNKDAVGKMIYEQIFKSLEKMLKESQEKRLKALKNKEA